MRLFFSLVAIAIVVTTTSCSESPSQPSDNQLLTATYDGSPWIATVRQGTWRSGQLTISGNDGQGRSISISATSVSAPNSYSFAAGNANAALASWIDTGRGQFSTAFTGTGTLTLATATATRIVGTFTFTAGNSAGSAANPPSVQLQGQFDLASP